MSKRNTPVKKLIKDIGEQLGERAEYAIKEIKWRFSCLDWTDQRAILTALLNSKDYWQEGCRILCCKECLWDNSFEPLIRKLWEKSETADLGALIMLHSPIDYIKQNEERILTIGESDLYSAIIQRYKEDKDYEIDECRMDDLSHLFIKAKSGRVFSEQAAKDVLYTTAHRVIIDAVKSLSSDLTSWHICDCYGDDCEYRFIMCTIGMKQCEACIRDMMGLNNVWKGFEDWHRSVLHNIHENKEFNELKSSIKPQWGDKEWTDYLRSMTLLICRHYYQALPSDYIHPKKLEHELQDLLNPTKKTLELPF